VPQFVRDHRENKVSVVFATLLSGTMFYLSQGLNDLGFLAWFAPAPLMWLAYGTTPNWSLTLASTAACFAGLIYAFECYGMLPPSLILPVILPQVVLFPAAVSFARLVQRRLGPIATLFAFPTCWTAFEYLIGLASPHGSWGSLAYSQVSTPYLIQSAALFGLYSVTFLICLFANAIAMALRLQGQARLAVGVGFAICALNVVFGLVRLAQPQSETIGVAAMVYGSATVAAHNKDPLAAAVNVSDTYARAIRSAAAKGAKLVVTPEGGIISEAPWRSAILAPLLAASKETGTQIVAGVYERVPPGDLAFSFGPDYRVHTYAKRHLVPLLEAQFTPGSASGWLGDGRAMEICKDMDFPRTIRRDAEKGIRLMAVPAGDFIKDGWLHGRMAIMRGVEDGFALVRAANDGLVTASDAEGRLVASQTVAPAGLTMIIARIPLGPGHTVYTHIGDAFAWLCWALFLSIGARSLVNRTSGTNAVAPESLRSAR
jgi:apolipoprotein N-acyltransferase